MIFPTKVTNAGGEKIFSALGVSAVKSYGVAKKDEGRFFILHPSSFT